MFTYTWYNAILYHSATMIQLVVNILNITMWLWCYIHLFCNAIVYHNFIMSYHVDLIVYSGEYPEKMFFQVNNYIFKRITKIQYDWTS